MSSRVKSRRGSILQLIIPLRALLRRFSFFFLICLSVGIIIIGRSNKEAFDTFRMMVTDAVTPALRLLSSPIQVWGDAKDSFNRYIFVYQENDRLRLENKRLARVQSLAEKLAAENRGLRELMHFVPDPLASYVTTRIITDISGPFSRTAIVSAGNREGLHKGQVVVNEKGLVGRIVDVGYRSSRLLLITDINSKIPVITGTSGIRAILAGNNTDTVQLIHLPLDNKILEGERVFTSGDGKFFPAGIPVGTVGSISTKGVIVTPYIDWSHLEFVSVVNYGAQE